MATTATNTTGTTKAETTRAKNTALTAVAPTAPMAVSLGTLQAASPAGLVQGASEMASALAQVINKQGLAKVINGRKYVRVEGWTTLGVMLGVIAREVSTNETDGVYVAVVELVRMSDGACISSASAECGAPDELDRYGKPIWASRPRYARRSMAQTRATGKACRLAFSWIMSLAGYEATPAEEMEPIEQAPPANASRAPVQVRQGPHAAPTLLISESQHRRIEGRINELRLDRERVKRWIRTKWGVERMSDLSPAQYQELDDRLEDFAEKVAVETEARQPPAPKGNGQDTAPAGIDAIAGAAH